MWAQAWAQGQGTCSRRSWYRALALKAAARVRVQLPVMVRVAGCSETQFRITSRLRLSMRLENRSFLKNSGSSLGSVGTLRVRV